MVGDTDASPSTEGNLCMLTVLYTELQIHF